MAFSAEPDAVRLEWFSAQYLLWAVAVSVFIRAVAGLRNCRVGDWVCGFSALPESFYLLHLGTSNVGGCRQS